MRVWRNNQIFLNQLLPSNSTELKISTKRIFHAYQWQENTSTTLEFYFTTFLMEIKLIIKCCYSKLNFSNQNNYLRSPCMTEFPNFLFISLSGFRFLWSNIINIKKNKNNENVYWNLICFEVTNCSEKFRNSQ